LREKFYTASALNSRQILLLGLEKEKESPNLSRFLSKRRWTPTVRPGSADKVRSLEPVAQVKSLRV